MLVTVFFIGIPMFIVTTVIYCFNNPVFTSKMLRNVMAYELNDAGPVENRVKCIHSVSAQMINYDEKNGYFFPIYRYYYNGQEYTTKSDIQLWVRPKRSYDLELMVNPEDPTMIYEVYKTYDDSFNKVPLIYCVGIAAAVTFILFFLLKITG